MLLTKGFQLGYTYNECFNHDMSFFHLLWRISRVSQNTLRNSRLHTVKMHSSITVAWFVLAFLSLSKVAQQFSEVSTAPVECPLHGVECPLHGIYTLYIYVFSPNKG